MVSAPERMFGHQLCKHLLTHKSCSGKHWKQRGQGSPDLETFLCGTGWLFHTNCRKSAAYSGPTSDLHLSKWEEQHFLSITPKTCTFLHQSPGAVEHQHFETATPGTLIPVDHKYEVLEKAFLLHLDPCTWHDSTDSIVALLARFRGVQALKGEV